MAEVLALSLRLRARVVRFGKHFRMQTNISFREFPDMS